MNILMIIISSSKRLPNIQLMNKSIIPFHWEFFHSQIYKPIRNSYLIFFFFVLCMCVATFFFLDPDTNEFNLYLLIVR